MGRMWRGGYRRFHPIGDRMGNEMVDVLEIGRLSGGVGGASALLLSSVWESAAKLLGTEKIAFFALSNCELMALVAEERIIHALKSGLFDAARESVPVEEYFPKSIYGLVSNKSGYCLHRF